VLKRKACSKSLVDISKEGIRREERIGFEGMMDVYADTTGEDLYQSCEEESLDEKSKTKIESR
jgi:hypothetical protein